MLRIFSRFRSLSRKKKVLVVVIVCVLALAVTGSAFRSSSSKKYTTVKAAKSTIVEVVSETGTINANDRTDIFSPTNGVIEEVHVRNGDSVKTGQELFTIKSSATEQEKTQALATYMAAKNALDTANASAYSLQAAMFSAWETHKTLAESDEYENSDGTPRYDKRSSAEYHIAEKNWLAAENNYKKQQAVIAQAQTALSSAYLAYQATQNAVVKATLDGVLANLSVAPGNSVKANSPTSPTVPLATIANLTTTEILLSLSENDIAKVHEGQDVEVKVNAVQGKKYRGTVRRVDTIGTSQQGIMRYNVYIEVTDADDRLRPGMNVDAVITTNKVTHVLAVPNAAVKPYQGGRAVRIVSKKGDVQYVPVQIGIRGKEKTQILTGIKEGQEVITSLSNEQIKRPGLLGS